jgi:hypothetical protein
MAQGSKRRPLQNFAADNSPRRPLHAALLLPALNRDIAK